MARKIYYTYNPETDNFERVFPTLKTRLARLLRLLLSSFAVGTGIFLVIYFSFDLPSEKNLREENAELRAAYSILNRRLENSLRVMDAIENRDDNLYRVIFQMDPVSRTTRLAGLDNESRYRRLSGMSDGSLVGSLSRNMDLFERRLYAQSQSFDQIRDIAVRQKDKMAHIPSVMPVKGRGVSLAAGFGMRRDPISEAPAFHAGVDFAAPEGTPVYATADGVIRTAERVSEKGNYLVIDHGFNYRSSYSHLSRLSVSNGSRVRRGDVIGTVGSTGRSTGPHLHYEVEFKDEPQDPVNFFFMDLTPEKYSEMVRLSDDSGHVMD